MAHIHRTPRLPAKAPPRPSRRVVLAAGPENGRWSTYNRLKVPPSVGNAVVCREHWGPTETDPKGALSWGLAMAVRRRQDLSSSLIGLDANHWCDFGYPWPTAAAGARGTCRLRSHHPCRGYWQP